MSDIQMHLFQWNDWLEMVYFLLHFDITSVVFFLFVDFFTVSGWFKWLFDGPNRWSVIKHVNVYFIFFRLSGTIYQVQAIALNSRNLCKWTIIIHYLGEKCIKFVYLYIVTVRWRQTTEEKRNESKEKFEISKMGNVNIIDYETCLK